MDIMLQDEQRHEWMDQMMGGEGSEQLASMHRLMGYRYLQSNGDLSSGLWGPGMSGYGMMGSWGGNSGWYASGSPDVMAGLMNPWLCAICLVLLLAVIVLIIALVKAKRIRRTFGSGTAKEIIRSRYAKGELSRKDYLQLKNDLKEK